MPLTTASDALKDRTKRFALRIIRLCRCVPRTPESRVISYQLLRSGTSVAANYRAACRARSSAEFVAKLGLVLEEADESLFWLELLVEAGIITHIRIECLLAEANALVAIFVASLKTAKANPKSRGGTEIHRC